MLKKKTYSPEDVMEIVKKAFKEFDKHTKDKDTDASLLDLYTKMVELAILSEVAQLIK